MARPVYQIPGARADPPPGARCQVVIVLLLLPGLGHVLWFAGARGIARTKSGMMPWNEVSGAR
jgi:hypothetical protein